MYAARQCNSRRQSLTHFVCEPGDNFKGLHTFKTKSNEYKNIQRT